MSIVREMSGSGQLAAAAGTCWLVVVGGGASGQGGGGVAYWGRNKKWSRNNYSETD